MGHGLTPAEVQGAQSGFNSVAQVMQALSEAKERQAQQANLQAQQDTVNKQNADRIKIEQQRADQEEAQRKDLSAKASKQLDLEQQRFDAEHELQSVQRQQLTQQLLHQYVLSGIPISGDNVSMAPGMIGMEQHSIPSLGINATLPSPALYQTQQAQQQADLARITNAPAEEAKTREQSAAQQAETERQLKLAAQNNIYETARQASSQRAQQALHDSEGALSLRKAMIEATGGLSEQDSGSKTGISIKTGPDGQPIQTQQPVSDFVTNTLRQLRDGQMSSDQLKKQFPKQAPVLLRMASEQGIGALTDTQKTRLDDLNTVAQVVPALKKMNEIAAQDPNNTWMNPTSDAYKTFNGLHQQVAGALPAISRALSGVKRFNGFEMEQYDKYLTPQTGISFGPLDTTKVGPNFGKYNDFVTHDIQDAFNSATSGLPQGQRDIIKQRIGLNNLPSLSNALQAPGVNSGTPSGMTPAVPSTPQAIHWVLQNGKLVQVGAQQ
jgi:hypothetical protein